MQRAAAPAKWWRGMCLEYGCARCRFSSIAQQNGAALCSQNCAGHGFGNKDIRAPSRSLMQAMPFEDVLTTITTVTPNCQSGQPAPWRRPVTRDCAPVTIRDLLQSSVFAISLHPVFAHVVFAQDLAGLLRKAPVSAGLRLVAALRLLRPMRMRALLGRMLRSGQSGRPLFMRQTRPGCRWQDRDRGPPAPD